MTFLRPPRAGLGLCLVSALWGCSGSVQPPPATDAGPTVDIAPDRAVPHDAPVDRVVVDVQPPAPIYGNCTSDAECQPGLTCTTAQMGPSGGQCNRACTSDDDCALPPSGSSSGTDGYCYTDPTTMARSCRQICANGADCGRDGYTCLTLNPNMPLNMVQICVAICVDNITCGAGTLCNHETGQCQAATTPPAATGRSVGQSCVPQGRMDSTEANRCRSGLCSPEANLDSHMNPAYTGFNGGSCFGRCILPLGYNAATFFGPGHNLPQAGCPTGAICFVNGSYARGDLGVCVPACHADSDCRASEGYFCRKSFAVSPTRSVTFNNGYCTPIDCSNTATPCPTGYTCHVQMVTGGQRGSCWPATP